MRGNVGAGAGCSVAERFPGKEASMNKTGVIVLILFAVVAFSGCSREDETSTTMKQQGDAGPVLQAGSGAAAADESTQTAAASEDGGQAAIAFESTEFDFGEVDQGEKVEHIFSFKNTGNGNLIIEKVRSS
jgi:hypothetical protein